MLASTLATYYRRGAESATAVIVQYRHCTSRLGRYVMREAGLGLIGRRGADERRRLVQTAEWAGRCAVGGAINIHRTECVYMDAYWGGFGCPSVLKSNYMSGFFIEENTADNIYGTTRHVRILCSCTKPQKRYFQKNSGKWRENVSLTNI